MNENELIGRQLKLNVFINVCQELNKTLNCNMDFYLMSDLKACECRFKTDKTNVAKLEMIIDYINDDVDYFLTTDRNVIAYSKLNITEILKDIPYLHKIESD
jgi:hypothetical protein